jgi:hypothetical protein
VQERGDWEGAQGDMEHTQARPQPQGQIHPRWALPLPRTTTQGAHSDRAALSTTSSRVPHPPQDLPPRFLRPRTHGAPQGQPCTNKAHAQPCTSQSKAHAALNAPIAAHTDAPDCRHRDATQAPAHRHSRPAPQHPKTEPRHWPMLQRDFETTGAHTILP